MANKKKLILTCLSLAMLLVISVMGTLAYQTTGTDLDNTNKEGNVEIVLTEDIGITGVTTVDANVTDGAAKDGKTYFDKVTPGDIIKNEIKVTNTNTGTAAYVEVTITINNADKIIAAYQKSGDTAILDGLGIALNNDKTAFIIGSCNNEYVKHIDLSINFNGTTANYTGNWFDTAKGNDPYIAALGNNEIRYTYYIYLPAEKNCVVFNKLNVPSNFDSAEMAMFNGLKIDVHSASVEAGATYNETDAETAFRNLYTKPTTTN